MAQRCKDKRARYRGSLRHAMTRVLPTDALRLLPADGRTRWTSVLLALCAIVMTWSGAATLKDRFQAARRCLLRWYPGRRRPGAGYEGFIAALRRCSARLIKQVARHYRTHVRRLAEARGRWRVDGWVAFGADSAKHDAPMTAANEARLGCAGKARSWPQVLLTTVFHLGSGLPWSFLRGRARSSGRRHLAGLIKTLPGDALLPADESTLAGFTGYDFWRTVIDSGRSFLIRVGSNVRLIEGLGVRARLKGDGIVWVWPARRQAERRPPPALRLIALAGARNRTMYLLTSVPEAERLGDAAASGLYGLRWGVEVMYRTLKQTPARRKLLSDSPRNARVELSWAMIGLWTLMLIKAERCAALPAGQGFAAVLRVLRRAMDGAAAFDVAAALGQLEADAYMRSGAKKSRHWPHKRRTKPPGRPKARNATDSELALAAELQPLRPAA